MINNRIELQVSANTSSSTIAGGFLDLYGDDDITINYAIKDIRDFASTTSTYSQNFKVPGTKNNNIIFQNLFLVGANGQFDPRKKAICSLVVDSIVIMDGFLQVVSIDVNDRDKPEYNVTIFSNVKGFNSAIKGKYLTDYDFSSLNHTLNVPTITNTWSGTPASPGYFYSIKDYGYDYTMTTVKGSATKEGIPIGNMWPDIYNKTIIDKIFSTEGYSYDSGLLSSATFQNTLIPFNGDVNTIMGSDYLSARTFIATETTLSSITFSQMRNLTLQEANQPYEYEYRRRIRANDIVSGSNVVTAYTQSASGDYYTFDQPAISQFSYTVNYEASFVTSNISEPSQIGVNFYRSTHYGGLYPFHSDLVRVGVGTGVQVFTTPICNNTNGNTTWAGQSYKPFSQGEQVWAELYLRFNHGYVAPSPSAIPYKITAGGITWKHFPNTQRTAGQLVNMNNIIPQKILVTDYLKSVFNMFNAYIEPSKTVPNRFTIEDFESFYAAGTQRDWSTKLDRSQMVTETIISEELAKKYTFTYKDDSDFLNTDYKTRINRVYGDWWYDTDNDFITKEEKVEVIFAPTPCDNVIGSSKFIVPKIGKYDNNGKFGKTNFNVRFLTKSASPLALATGEYWRFTGATTYSTYPYIGHLNNPLTGTFDLNWGSVPYVYYPFQGSSSQDTINRITENNLINTYWKKYLDEVSDKDAKLITAYFKLSPKDIWDFNFNDTVFVDGLTSEGGHYYRVNNISYSTNPDKLSKVELIKILTKYTTKYPSRRMIFNTTEVGIGHVGLSLGGAQVLYRGSVGIGDGTIVWGDSSMALGNQNVLKGYGGNVFGDINVVGAGTTGTTVFGSNNTIDDRANSSTIIGNDNYIVSGATATYIRGNRNRVVLGNQISINGYDNSINTDGLSYTTENVTINGIGNIAYGQTTGATVTGNYNYISGNTTNLTIVGHSNSASTNTTAITINGDYNYINPSSKKVSINGSSNVLLGTNSGVTVYGDTNTVNAGSKNIVINGFGNTISAGTINVTVLGMNSLSTVLSNTVYTPSVSVNNYFMLGTASTITMGGGVVAAGATVGIALGSGVTVSSGASFGTGLGNLTEVTMVGEFAIASDGNYGQAGTVMLQNQTVNAQALELYTQVSTTSRFTIASGTSYFTRLYTIATDITNQHTIAYEGRGIISNKSGTTSLVGPILMKAVGYDAYMSATSLSVSANTSNDSLIVTASGQTSTTINWICQVDYTKINQIL